MDIEFHLTEATDRSHEEMRDLLQAALHGVTTLSTGDWLSIRAVYDDHVVYGVYVGEGAPSGLTRRTYVIAENGTVTLGDAEPVVERREFEPVNEAATTTDADTDTTTAAAADDPVVESTLPPLTPPGTLRTLADGSLLEAVDGSDGWLWRVQVIRAGVSANENEYPLPTLHEAAPLYDGRPVFYGAGRDHNPHERGFASIAGYITNPIPNPHGVEATLEVNRGKPDVREAISHAYGVQQRTKRSVFGFSHVVPAGEFASEARKPRGRRVTKINRIESVDLVMSPAAGGALLSPLSEAVVDPLQEAIVNLDAILARYRAGEVLTPEEYGALHQNLGSDALSEARSATGSTATATTATSTTAAATDAGDTVLSEAMGRIQAMEQRAQLAESRATLTTALTEARLPQVIRTNIEADFGGRIFEAADLEARITRERNTLAELNSVRPSGLGLRVEVTQDSRDKMQESMDGMFGFVRGATPRQDRVVPWYEAPAAFQSIRQAFTAITGVHNPNPRQVLAEAVRYLNAEEKEILQLQESIISSTFGEILGDSISRRMIADYQDPEQQAFMRLVSNVTPLTDFRTNHRTRLGGYGDLPTVLEGGTYQALTSPGDEEVTYSPTKRGGLEDLTLEMIANDDMGVVRQIPVRMAQAAVRTLRHAIFGALRDNPTIYDSNALFDNSAHGNLGSTALSGAAMTTTRALMRTQTPYGVASQPLGASNLPRFLLVPAELEEIAFKLANSMPYVLASNENATTPNLHRGLEYLVVDEWTDATDWVAMADPMKVPTIELGFLNGRVEPELFVQDAANVGSVFNADKITYKIRHIWGFAFLDWRGFYKHVVSG